MKVDPAVQRRLLELADVDAELGRIDHRRRHLPELTELAEAEEAQRAAKDALVSVQTTASDLDRELKRQEREVDTVRVREDKDRKLLASGSVSAKQLTDLQHELGTLERRQTALEDDLLELMERREAVGLDEQRTAAQVEAIEQKLQDLRVRRDDAIADLDSAQSRRDADRSGLVSAFPADLLARYDRVRASRGIGAGLLRARSCGACQLEFDRSTMMEYTAAAADEVISCENCGAILVRTEESGL